MTARCRRPRPRRLGVERDAEPGGGEHVDVVGPVADRHALRQRHARLARRTAPARPPCPAGRRSRRATRPVSRPSTTSSSLAATKSSSSSSTRPAMTWVNPPDTTPQRNPRRLSVRIVVRAPGVSSSSPATSASTDAGSPASVATRAPQRLGEVELAAHRRLGDRPDLGLGARVRGQHLDHLALHERGVDVEDDQPLAAPGQPGPLHRDVHARRVRATSTSFLRSVPGG